MPVMCVSSSLIVCDNVQYIGLIMIHSMFSRPLSFTPIINATL